MSFRTVVIKNRAKLEYQLNYLVVRGEEEKRISLSEIGTLIIETTAVAVTAVLLCELAKRNITTIFCDEKYNPCFECAPYSSSFENSKRIKNQIAWNKETKGFVWQKIVKEKILQQAIVLERVDREEASLLRVYHDNVEINDFTNREGHAAKVYFNALFGKSFSRQNKEEDTNIALNYGYSIILSTINRNVVASGYLTQIGIWHDNEYNQFNLSCDLMEPLRPIIDYEVICLAVDEDFKKALNKILNKEVRINGFSTKLDNAITIYIRSVFDALANDDITRISFIEKYE